MVMEEKATVESAGGDACGGGDVSQLVLGEKERYS